MPLEEAWNRAKPTGYSLILSGHVHLFEFLDLGEGRPDQVVVGDGGTAMAAPIQATIRGTAVHGVTTSLDDTEHNFGYTLFTKDGSGWKLMLKTVSGQALATCHIPGDSTSCQAASSAK